MSEAEQEPSGRSTPAVPPSLSGQVPQITVPLSAVLAHAELGLRHVAGPVEDRPVAMVHTTEWEDPTAYLLGGELLLTAGRHLGAVAQDIDAYVTRLVAADVAALGFGVAPVYDEVPAELVAACDRHGLRLLRVPPQTPFVAVGQAVHLAMAEVRSRDLRRMSQAQAALASAAARPDAVEAVLRQLASHLGAWVALLDGEGEELFGAGLRPAEPAPQRLRDLALRLSERRRPTAKHPQAVRTPGSDTEHQGGRQLFAHTLPGGDTGSPLVLGLASPAQLSAVERSVTGVAVVLLSLLTGPRRALGGDTRSAAALVRLLFGADAAEVAALLHPATEGRSQRWVVVHGRRAATAARRAQSSSDAVHVAALGTALGTPFLEVDGDSLRAAVPLVKGGFGDGEPGSTAGDAPARLGWTLGVSSPATTAELPLAAARAERALRRALGTGSRVVRDRGDELSLHALVAPDGARALARARFAPLADAGAPGAEVLLETLRTWLSLNCSWDRTAVALGLHRNTARQRIMRLGRLLDADLQDADVRMELWFALRWLPGRDEPGGRTQ
ncbi:PucR family transcriptional regulator [Streptomyces sp. NPDC096012]|uniref:PucR family transcriptional regulator n=1 Tax=Streptomyces sp. NPDC096012 TaxID=3155684 RepID=UPI00336ACE76